MAVQLAQLNIALPSEPLDSVLLADFVAALEPVNGSARHMSCCGGSPQGIFRRSERPSGAWPCFALRARRRPHSRFAATNAAPGTDLSAAPAYERTQLVTDDRGLCPAG
jgi:hypothetical protein